MDVHNYRRRLEQSVNKILSSDMPQENKDALADFKSHLSAKGLSIARVEHYVFHLSRIYRFIGKRFGELTDADVLRVLESIHNHPEWGGRYKHDLKISLRVFLRWLCERKICDVDASVVRSRYRNKQTLPEEILTEDEIKGLAEACDNLRDRAFVLVLYESGCRIGEILGMKIKHIQANEYGFALTVSGKTGSRRVLILSSAPALANWLNIHPYRNNPESYVWLGLSNRNKNEPLVYPGVLMMLKKIAERAGIKKRVNPHSFRHARATHLANHLTEAQMKQYFGWVQGSDMASIYVHLSGRDVDSALLKLNGIKIDERKVEERLKAQTCPRCGQINSPASKFCCKCGSPLRLDVALTAEEVRASGDEVVNELVKDSDIQEVIIRKMLISPSLKEKMQRLLA